MKVVYGYGASADPFFADIGSLVKLGKTQIMEIKEPIVDRGDAMIMKNVVPSSKSKIKGGLMSPIWFTDQRLSYPWPSDHGHRYPTPLRGLQENFVQVIPKHADFIKSASDGLRVGCPRGRSGRRRQSQTTVG